MNRNRLIVAVLVVLAAAATAWPQEITTPHFDDAEFFVFADNFETGTCSAWSSSIPYCITPEVGLRVELTWDTSADPDQTDEVGTDLDLHLRHPDAGDVWLGSYDCYSSNPSPGWGAAGATNDPDLVFEDDDGAGPEAIQITEPETAEYDIGIHYVDDLSYGASSATVRVFVDGTLVYEYPNKTLFDGEFWHLGAVQWPGGSVTEVDTVSSGIP